MSELKTGSLLEQPNHFQRAERFITHVTNEIVPKYPTLEIRAENLTFQNLSSYPALHEATKLDGNLEAIKDLEGMDHETDIDAALATSVMVTIFGDEKKTIEFATRVIDRIARRLGGLIKKDSGINQARLRESLTGVLGHRPELEDLPLLNRFLFLTFQ